MSETSQPPSGTASDAVPDPPEPSAPGALDAPPDRLSRPFKILWSGQIISLAGSYVVQFAVVWWLTKTTGSGTVLATATFLGLAPQVLLGPLLGTLVDRWDRKKVILLSDSVVAFVSVILAVLFYFDSVELWHLYVIVFIRAVAGGFQEPAVIAVASLMVHPNRLTHVHGIHQALVGGMTVLTAPLGALLIEQLPMHQIMLVDIVTAAFAIGPLLFLAVPKTVRTEGAAIDEARGVWRELADGGAYLWARTGLVVIFVLFALVNFLVTPAFVLLPLLVTEHFGGNAMQLAWLTMAFGVGTVAGGILLGVWGGFRRRILTTLSGMIILGAFIAAIAFVPASGVKLAVALFFLVGAMVPMVNGPMMAVVQVTVANEYQGRVYSLLKSAAGAISPIGLIIAGPIADVIGIRSLFLASGVVCSVAGVVGFLLPVLLRFEQEEAIEVEAEGGEELGEEA